MQTNKFFSLSRWARTLVVVVLFSCLAGPVHAASFEPSPWTEEPTYLGKISQKLGFGFLNITAGWTELFFEPTRDKNFFVGVGKGIGLFVTDTLGGVLDAATFPIPVDIPLPQGGIAHEYKK